MLRSTLALAFLSLAALAAEPQVIVTQVPGGAAVLESPFLRVRIEPALGGAVTELLDKRSGKNLAGSFEGERPPAGFGLLNDRFWPKSGGQVRNLETSPYEMTLTHPTAEKPVAVVVLRKKVEAANAKDMLVEKTLTLHPALARLQADYAVSNTGATPQINRLWVANVLRPDGVRCEKLTYFSPAPEGVVATPFDPENEEGANIWIEPQRDWRTVIGASGAGAAATAYSSHLETFYSCFPGRKSGSAYPTFEWLFQSFQYNPLNPPEGAVSLGQPFKARFVFIPFSGLSAVHGASEFVVGEIVPDPATGRVGVRLASCISETFDVKLRAVRLPSPEPRELPAQQKRASPASNADFTFDLGPLAQGSHVLTAEVTSRKTGKAVLERLVTVGEASGKYEMARLTPKAPPAAPAVPTTLPTALASPAVPWAKPLASGKLRVLFVLPHRSLREAVEVWQRVDCDFEVLRTFNVTELEATQQKPLAQDAKMLELLAKDWDVIVFGATYWRMWPKKVQEAIAAKIAAGTGVVYVWPYGNHFMTSVKGAKATQDAQDFVRQALPMNAVPPWQDLDPAKAVTLMQYQKGRMALLDYPVAPDPRGIRAKAAGGLTPLSPVSDADYPFWEYHHSLLAKALIWAANKTPAVQMQSLKIEAAEAGTRLAGAVSGGPAQVTLSVWAHDSAGAAVQAPDQTLALAPGQPTPFAFALPPMRHAGRWFATVFVKSSGATLDWRTVALDVPSPAALAATAELPCVLQKGAPLSASIAVKASAPLKATLRSSIVDATGRLLAQREDPVDLAAPAEKAFPITLVPAGALASRHYLECVLLDGDRRLASLRLPFAVDCRRYDDYLSIIWGGGDGSYIGEVARQSLADLDCFDAVVTSAGHADMHKNVESMANGLAARGLGVYAINMHHMKCDEPVLVRKPCLTDPEHRKALTQEFASKSAWLARFAPVAWLMGDEMSLGPENQFTDVCQSPTCLAGFRQYLQGVYGDVARLNASWGTRLASFDEARPFTLREAQAAKNFAPWNDHRAFMDTVYAGAFAFARGVIAQRDPGAIIGYSGGATQHIAVNGYNRYLLYQTCKAVTDYGPDSPDLMRCFMAGPHVSSWWWGMYGGGPEDNRRSTPWRLIFRGVNGSGFFAAYGAGYNIFSDFGVLDPDFSPKPNVADGLRQDVSRLRHGLGKLLLSSRRLNDGIAVHYSMPSVRAAYARDEAPVNERLWNAARWGAEACLRDLGHQFDVVAPEQIEAGALDNFRVLVLPLSQALSPAEAKAIAAFVHRGGLLIADTLAGRFDNHLNPAAKPLLADVLGLSAGAPNPDQPKALLKPAAALAKAPDLEINLLCDRIASAGAQPLASGPAGPAAFLNASGKGAACVFNFTFAPYVDARATERGQAMRAWMAAVLTRHGLAPEVAALKRGQSALALEITQFDAGAARFVGLLQDHTVAVRPGREVEIRFPRRAHVVDVIAGKVLGETDRVETDLIPARAKLYALLPERPAAPTVSAPAQTAPGQTLRIEARLGAAPGYGRALRIELAGPDGKKRPACSQNLFSLEPGLAAEIPLALNDPAGLWTVTATDPVTGLSATSKFTVAPR